MSSNYNSQFFIISIGEEQTVYSYLKFTLFPEDAPPVIVSDHKDIFEEVTIAFVDQKYLQVPYRHTVVIIVTCIMALG